MVSSLEHCHTPPPPPPHPLYNINPTCDRRLAVGKEHQRLTPALTLVQRLHRALRRHRGQEGERLLVVRHLANVAPDDEPDPDDQDVVLDGEGIESAGPAE